jgi:uncharacterized membrane protein YecN with MAPEG domain
MTDIPVTLTAAGVLGLMYMGLSFNVVRYRVRTRTMLGDGAGKPGGEALNVAIRVHGNFMEYVPLALILLGGIEAAGAPRMMIVLLAAALVVSRLMHPFGMTKPAPNFFRAGGAMLTYMVIIVASVTALTIAW